MKYYYTLFTFVLAGALLFWGIPFLTGLQWGSLSVSELGTAGHAIRSEKSEFGVVWFWLCCVPFCFGFLHMVKIMTDEFGDIIRNKYVLRAAVSYMLLIALIIATLIYMLYLSIAQGSWVTVLLLFLSISVANSCKNLWSYFGAIDLFLKMLVTAVTLGLLIAAFTRGMIGAMSYFPLPGEAGYPVFLLWLQALILIPIIYLAFRASVSGVVSSAGGSGSGGGSGSVSGSGSGGAASQAQGKSVKIGKSRSIGGIDIPDSLK